MICEVSHDQQSESLILEEESDVFSQSHSDEVLNQEQGEQSMGIKSKTAHLTIKTEKIDSPRELYLNTKTPGNN